MPNRGQKETHDQRGTGGLSQSQPRVRERRWWDPFCVDGGVPSAWMAGSPLPWVTGSPLPWMMGSLLPQRVRSPLPWMAGSPLHGWWGPLFPGWWGSSAPVGGGSLRVAGSPLHGWRGPLCPGWWGVLCPGWRGVSAGGRAPLPEGEGMPRAHSCQGSHCSPAPPHPGVTEAASGTAAPSRQTRPFHLQREGLCSRDSVLMDSPSDDKPAPPAWKPSSPSV